MELTIRCPAEVRFGRGVIRALGGEAAKLGTKALVVTGRRALRESGRLGELEGLLGDAGVEAALFDRVEPEPSLDTVGTGMAAARSHGCDVVVTIGGGSAMDVGKAIAACANAPRPLDDYFAGAEVVGPALPIIACPTTSGTGAEVTPNAVLSDPATGVKRSIRGSTLMPRVALVDPEATYRMPSRETAYCGLDALTQSVESYISTGANLYSEPLSLRAVELTGRSLRRAVSHGDDVAAREAMSLGSLLAGLGLASARLGLVHGIAHPLGALLHLPHGLACALLLPHVLRLNVDVASAKLARCAEAVGLGVGASAHDFILWVEELCADLGAATPLGELGCTAADLDVLAQPSVTAGSTKFNPKPVDEEDVRAVLLAAGARR